MRANDAHALQWKRLYQAAIFELDPAKSIRRIAEARSAVLDRIEEGFSKTSEGETFALGNALHMLSALRHIAEREIGEQKRIGT
jgi:hypothetical protein